MSRVATWGFVVVGVLGAWGCVRPQVAAPQTRPPVGQSVGPLRATTRPAVALAFDAPDRVLVDDAGRRVEHDIGPRDPAGGVVVADVGASRGAMLPLAQVVGEGRRAFEVGATPVCPVVWLLDVAAPTLATTGALEGDAKDLRVGCGPVAHADFVTAVGRERTIVYGEAAFDPRSVAAELGVLRTDLERQFEVAIAERWLNEIAIVPAGDGPYVLAEAVSGGLRIRVDAASRWAAEHRLAAASTVARIWLGALLDRLAPAHGDTTPARAALVHGLALGMARETLLELGLVTPDEYAASLSDAQRLVAGRTGVWRTEAVDARDVAAEAAARSIEVSQLAWSLRDRGTPMSLPMALAVAVREGAPRDVGPLWAAITGELPRGVQQRLGPCVVARATKTDAPDLGLSLGWSPGGPSLVGAVREGGVAARGGVQVGDELVHAITDEGSVTLSLVRAGRRLSVAVDAPPRAVAVRQWARRRDVPDERCYPAI